MKQVIRPFGKGTEPSKFISYWINATGVSVVDTGLILSFTPLKELIAKRYPKVLTYVLVHWQAKPKGLRRWGIYDSLTDTYYSTNEINGSSQFITLQLDETIVKTVPTAVLFFPNCKITSYSDLATTIG